MGDTMKTLAQRLAARADVLEALLMDAEDRGLEAQAAARRKQLAQTRRELAKANGIAPKGGSGQRRRAASGARPAGAAERRSRGSSSRHFHTFTLRKRNPEDEKGGIYGSGWLSYPVTALPTL